MVQTISDLEAERGAWMVRLATSSATVKLLESELRCEKIKSGAINVANEVLARQLTLMRKALEVLGGGMTLTGTTFYIPDCQSGMELKARIDFAREAIGQSRLTHEEEVIKDIAR